MLCGNSESTQIKYQALKVDPDPEIYLHGYGVYRARNIIIAGTEDISAIQ